MDELINMMLIENLELEEIEINNFRVPRNPSDPFTRMREEPFIKAFRLTKHMVNDLTECLEPYMVPQRRATDLDITSKVLIALNFFANGSHQTSVGENKFLDVSQPTVSRCIKEVSDALNQPRVFNEWVRMPENLQELNVVRLKFYEKHGFSGVAGCVDCTHVAIVRPKMHNPEHPKHLYVNRKNYHSINVQLICDADLKIMNVDASFPGSTNDAYIWSRSNAQEYFKNLHAAGHNNYFLLGDSGYPLRTWLRTPLDGEYDHGTPEYNYNVAHKNTRVKIECCNGVLKNRFRCLLRYRTLHADPSRACRIINACVVLHNMCINYGLPEPEENNEFLDFGMVDRNGVIDGDAEENAIRRVNPELLEGRRARRRIIIRNFTQR